MTNRFTKRIVGRCDSWLSLSFILAVVIASNCVSAPLLQGEEWDTMSDTWAATDALGRSVAAYPDVAAPRPNKTVGLFYYLWHGQHDSELHDIGKILARDPGAIHNWNSPYWGPPSVFHYWAEPLFGYYKAPDEWVIRKQMQMIADAGIDVLIFDVTNGFDYRPVYSELCRILAAMRKAGCKVPQVAFLAYAGSRQVVQKLFADFYSKGEHRDLWFLWKGKPLLLADSAEFDDAWKNFFNIRHSWAWQPGQDKWPWLENSPQQGGWHDSPDKIEQIPVATAQHPTSSTGKSYHAGRQPPNDQLASGQGLFFDEQWKRALAVDPEFVFVTQWNEWCAQRYQYQGETQIYAGRPIHKGDPWFIDVYNEEFNRDIEPMKGGYGDNYYYQLVDNVRRYKGARPVPAASAAKTINIRNFEDWKDVEPEYRDDVGDAIDRDSIGIGGVKYVHATARNDLKRMKAARDARNVYFYVETAKDLTPKKEAKWNWMNLFIGVDSRQGVNWEGFHYVLKNNDPAADAMQLLRFTGDGKWTVVGDIPIVVNQNRLALAIPRSMLELPENDAQTNLTFKWADNMQDADPLHWLVYGDTAPNGRFRYRYQPLK